VQEEQKQLAIRLVTQDDMAFVKECFTDDQLLKEIGLTLSPHPQARRWAFAMWRQSGDFWAITLQKVPIGLVTSFVVAPGVREVGYFILAPWQKQGLMTKTLQKLISCLRDRGQTNELVATTRMDNLASQHVLIKNGFRKGHQNKTIINWSLKIS
jgi:[ribosomal protein S5]-alanine N-acetyltransferase